MSQPGLTEEQQPPWKRAKELFRSREEADAAFYDALSSLCLTRRALQELNRRNRRIASATSVRWPPVQSIETASLKGNLSEIKRFARHGGPNLCDLS